MKIGILTYHRSHNYGALLQSIATRVILEELGHQAYFVDYWPSYHRRVYKMFSLTMLLKNGIVGSRNYLYNVIRYFLPRKKRISAFDNFINQYIVPYCLPDGDEYDVIVHGSDQIWRIQSSLKDYNPEYFGVHSKSHARKNISYAASIDKLPNSTYEKERFLELVNNFDSISVREQETLDFLFQNGVNCAELNLDPTLLLTCKQWEQIIPFDQKNNEKYILFYDLLSNSFDRKEIEQYAKRKGIKLITLYSSVRVKESDTSITTAGPMAFLQLIYGAKMVFTSSFHGLVFSIIFNKQVLAAFGSRQGRALTLLSNLGILDNLLAPCCKFPDELPVINYDVVNSKLEELRKPSIDCLKENCKRL